MDSPSLLKKDVFISYSAADQQWAEDACAAIEARQHSCWIAPRDIVPGSEWGAAIISGIDACRIMVLIFSSEANSSPQVRREIERGVGKGLILLPFRVENVTPSGALEYALSNTHWLDGFKSPRQRQLDLLADAISQLITGTASGAFPAVGQRPPRIGPTRKVWWLTAIAAAVVLLAALMILFAASNSSPSETKKEEGEVIQIINPDDSEEGLQVLPSGGLWRFELKGRSENASEVLAGHFRIRDKMRDRRVFCQKDKPTSLKFERHVGIASRASNWIQVDFSELRVANQEKNFQLINGKARLNMESTGVWSGILVDAEKRKWDFRCTRMAD